jgi:dTDP-glucose 4,6-dehydratase
VHVAARRPEEFFRRAPEFRQTSQVRLLAGDTRELQLDDAQRITHIVHAATAASASLNDSDPVEMAHVAAEGTRAVLALARKKRVERVLFTSSGAIYGKLPPDVTHVREDQMGVMDPLLTRNAYGEAKRLAELYCAGYVEKYGTPVVLARCFAFVGPYLPLDAHFAIGNFMLNALRRQPITVRSDGSPIRSYLYASDLAHWLLTLLVSGTPGRAYNVGSEYGISVGDLAKLVGQLRGVPVEILGKMDPDRLRDRYLPSTERIRSELGLRESVSLEQALSRTMAWYERMGLL